MICCYCGVGGCGGHITCYCCSVDEGSLLHTGSSTSSPSSVDTPPISPQTTTRILEDNEQVKESESNLPVGGAVLTPTTTPPQTRKISSVYNDISTPEVILVRSMERL